ncbi:phosphinothricin acetyltransferase [Herbaspirillum sp. Sphag1AN]|uniref:arsinothricin resistance N-acetyltransferase ArsN1 family B n=1 Tax=unclassified Herbaspirillum TaxID=2624150 RepID=UPI001610F638|nr:MULTISPECIES: arsinothricin resistance N-acetyltransferase ArsN1 family B [unclassified Herbaspirillum]MBB3213357.1 phosphinothricin acetyltransferase [Herbaspirillum sp. Sphag1AN]MBB3246599.1 phosphinothricin acetyltransferase [Herbaspirillum sp. Sphag64]
MNSPIRPVTVADAAAICEIYNHYVTTTGISFELEPVSVEQMTQRITDIASRYAWLVYEEQGRVLGYAYASQWKPRLAYRYSVESSVYLAADSGGKGVGAQLYGALFAQLKQREVHVIMAGIALPNAASIGLHEKMGFVKVGHFREVGNKFDQWLDVGYWQLIL